MRRRPGSRAVSYELVEERHECRDHLVGSFVHQPVAGTLYHGAGHIVRNQLHLVDKERARCKLASPSSKVSSGKTSRRSMVGIMIFAFGRIVAALKSADNFSRSPRYSGVKTSLG